MTRKYCTDCGIKLVDKSTCSPCRETRKVVTAIHNWADWYLKCEADELLYTQGILLQNDSREVELEMRERYNL